MSTQSILTKNRMSTNRAIDEYFMSYSVDVLKKLRFDVGCYDPEKMRYMMRLKRLVCADYCKIDDDQRQSLREEVIKKTILKLIEL